MSRLMAGVIRKASIDLNEAPEIADEYVHVPIMEGKKVKRDNTGVENEASRSDFLASDVRIKHENAAAPANTSVPRKDIYFPIIRHERSSFVPYSEFNLSAHMKAPAFAAMEVVLYNRNIDPENAMDGRKRQLSTIEEERTSFTDGMDGHSSDKETDEGKKLKKVRKKKCFWDQKETKALLDGVKRYGVGKWSKIINDPEFAPFFTKRISEHLKDRWASLTLYDEKRERYRRANNGRDEPLKSINTSSYYPSNEDMDTVRKFNTDKETRTVEALTRNRI